MASKPTRTARWATDGGATLEPSGAEKDTGWVPDDRPPARHMNFLQNTAFQWFDWLNERILDDPTDATTMVRARLGTTFGLRVGTSIASIGPLVGDLGDGLHIKNTDVAGGVDAGGDNLVIEEDGNAGLTILSGNGGAEFGSIFFADADDTDVGSIRYLHLNNRMEFTVNANLQLTLADGLTKVGIGTFVPDLGRGLHIKLGDNGIATVEPEAEELVLENSADCGMTIASGSTSLGVIYFADLDADVGRIEYAHTGDRMSFFANTIKLFEIGGSSTLGFYGVTTVARQDITGSRGGNAALADLLTKLALTGLITDSTT